MGRGGVHLGNLLISGWKTLISTQSCRKAPGGVGGWVGVGGVDQWIRGGLKGEEEDFLIFMSQILSA